MGTVTKKKQNTTQNYFSDPEILSSYVFKECAIASLKSYMILQGHSL